MIKFHNYTRLDDMPRPIYRVCRTMGHSEFFGHLRSVIYTHEGTNNYPHDYHFRSAYVMEVNGKVIGWACLYTINEGSQRYVSVWIQTRHRRKGYGKLLITKAKKSWNRYKPVRSNSLCNVGPV